MGAVARFNSGVCTRSTMQRQIPLSGYRILRCPECGKICPVLKCVEFPVCPKCRVSL